MKRVLLALLAAFGLASVSLAATEEPIITLWSWDMTTGQLPTTDNLPHFKKGSYTTLADALAAVDKIQSSITTTYMLRLEKDLELTEPFVYSHNLRERGGIDLNGYTLTAPASSVEGETMLTLSPSHAMRIVNGTIRGDFAGQIVQTTGTSLIVFENVTIENTNPAGAALKIGNKNVRAVHSTFKVADATTAAVVSAPTATASFLDCVIDAGTGVAIATSAGVTTLARNDSTVDMKVTGGLSAGATTQLVIAGGQYTADPATYALETSSVSALNDAGVYVVTPANDAAKIVETGIAYASFQEALNAATAGQTIQILKETVIDDLMPVYAGEGLIYIDINGFKFETQRWLRVDLDKMKFTGGWGVTRGQLDTSTGSYQRTAVLPTFEAALAHRNSDAVLKASDYRVAVYDPTLIMESSMTIPHQDANNQRGKLIVREGYTLDLDLNGQTLDVGLCFVNEGALTIKDSGGTGLIKSAGQCLSNSGTGTCTFESGTLQGYSTGVGVGTNASFTMTGGTITITADSTDANYAIANDGTTLISGGDVLGKNGLGISNYGDLTITGGTISTDSTYSTDDTIVCREDATLTISGNPTITSGGTSNAQIAMWGESTADITGQTGIAWIESSNESAIILKDSTVEKLANGASLTMINSSTSSNLNLYGNSLLQNSTTGTVTNKGTATIDGGNYGKVTNSGTLTITGDAIVTSTSGTALTNTAGVTTIESGTFNAASGSSSTVNATGGMIILPTGSVTEGGTGTQDTTTGEWEDPVVQTVKIGSTYYAYTTFEEVMAKATASSSATVKLLTNFTAVEATTIAAGKTVTLDLNGYTVAAPDVAPFITVKGALTLSSDPTFTPGVLMGTQTLVKVDGGSLTLAGGNLTLGTAESPVALTSETAVIDVTSGSFAQTGGTIVANTTGAAAIGVKTAVPLALGAATMITVPNDGASTAIATTTADATVTISGGEYTKVGQAATDPIAIKNGIFDVKPEDAYVLEGYKSEQNDAGKWVIAPALGNVTITDGDGNLTTYETLDAAFAALKTIASPSACTVKLWVDVNLAAKTTLSTYAPGVIDLNGCTINTPEVEEDALILSPTGSLKVMNGCITGVTTDTFGEPIVYVNGGTDVTFENLDIINTHTKGNILEVTNKAAKFTAIGCDFATTGAVGTDSGSFVKAMQIKAPDTTFKNCTITGAKKSTGSKMLIAQTTTLVMDNVTMSCANDGISITNSGTVTLTDVDFTSAGVTLSISGGTVSMADSSVATTGTSETAVSLSNTTATLDRVELLATGSSSTALYTSGTCNVTATNCTIAAGSYAAEVRGTSTVTLTGADTTVSGRGYYVYGSTLNLTAGTHKVTNSSWMGVYGSGTARVTGGTYSKDPTSYVPTDEGYSVKKNTDNTWTVTRAVAEVNGVEVENIMEAINASSVAGPIVVRILNNVTETLTIDADKSVDIDLNGKTLAGPLTSAGTLILTDSVGGGALTGEPALAITGGTATIYGFHTTVNGALDIADGATVSISGGTYTVDPTAYLATGYSVHKDETAGTWTVVNADGVPDGAVVALYDADGNYLKAYPTLQAAEDETADISTCTWKLLEDIVLSESTVSIANNPAVFDLAGHTITTEQSLNFSPTTTPLLVKDGTIIGTNTLGSAVGLYGTAKTTLQNVKVEYTGANSAVQISNAPFEAVGCEFICHTGASSNITIGNSAAVNIRYTAAPESPVVLSDCVITEERDGKNAILLTEAATATVTGVNTVVTGGIQVAETSTLTITGGTYTADPKPYVPENLTTLPNENGSVTVATEAFVTVNGIEVSGALEDVIETAIAATTAGTSDGMIDLTTNPSHAENHHALVTEAIQKLAATEGATGLTLVVDAEDATVAFDNAAITTIAEQIDDTTAAETPVVLTVKEIAKEEEGAVADAEVTYEITMKQGDTDVFPNEEATTGNAFVTVDYVATEGTKVFFVDGDGTREEVTYTKSADGQQLTFAANHFSTYIIAEAVAKIVTEGVDGAEPTTAYYMTLQEAIDAVPADATEATTLRLLADVDLNATVTIENKNVIIDGDKGDGTCYTLTGPKDAGSAKIVGLAISGGVVTLQNMNFTDFDNTSNIYGSVIDVRNGTSSFTAKNLTINLFTRDAFTIVSATKFLVDGCNIDCTPDPIRVASAYSLTKGFQIGSAAAAKIVGTISNTKVTHAESTYEDWSSGGIEVYANVELTIEDCEITNSESGIVVDNYWAGKPGYTAAPTTVTVKNTTVETPNDEGWPVFIMSREGQTNSVSLNIESGTYTGYAGYIVNGDGGYLDTYDTNIIAISGGTFSEAIPEEACATGFIPTATTVDGVTTYGVKQGSYTVLNTTTNTKYETLEAALDAAEVNDTLTLLADVDTGDYIPMFTKGDVTDYVNLDINGHILRTPHLLHLEAKTHKHGTLTTEHAHKIFFTGGFAMTGWESNNTQNCDYLSTTVYPTLAQAQTLKGAMTAEEAKDTTTAVRNGKKNNFPVYVISLYSPEVTLTEDITLPTGGGTTSAFAVRQGYAVTFDLAGHKIDQETCTGMVIGVFRTSGDLTLIDSSEDKSGVVEAGASTGYGTSGTVLIASGSGTVTLKGGLLTNKTNTQKQGSTGILNIGSGVNVIVDGAEIVYEQGYYAAVNYGSLTLDSGSIEAAGTSYSYLTIYNSGATEVNMPVENVIYTGSDKEILVTVPGIQWMGQKPTVPEDGTLAVVDGWVVTADTVAMIAGEPETFYPTLAEAIAAAKDGETVTLLKSTSGSGIIVPEGTYATGLTVDFNGKTYTVNADPLAGSTGTETLGFQLLKDNNITFKNGKIRATNPEVKMLVQNYSNLTLEGMTLDGTPSAYSTNNIQYVLSNNNGTTVLKGGTTITATEDQIAFDVCRYASYPSVAVTVEDATVNGTIEVSGEVADAQSATLTLTKDANLSAATLKIANDSLGAVVTKDPAATLGAPAGFEWTAQDDGSQMLTKLDVSESFTVKPNIAEGGTAVKGELGNDGLVTITATANEGYTFVGWSGEGFTALDAKTNVTITVENQDADLIANFIPTTVYDEMTNSVAKATLAQEKLIPYQDIVDLSVQNPTIEVTENEDGTKVAEVGIRLMKANTLMDEDGVPDWTAVVGDDTTDVGYESVEADLIKVILKPTTDTQKFFRFIPVNGLK